MKSYSELKSGKNGQDKCLLFDRLKDAIDSIDIDTVKEILTSKDKYLQEVLGTCITENNADGTADSFTFLTYAIEFWRKDVAHTILDNADQNDLEALLSVESINYYGVGIKVPHTALSLAEEKGYTDLAEKIEGKMKELGIPILRKENKIDLAKEARRRMEESLKKERESFRTLNRVERDELAKKTNETIERLKIKDSEASDRLKKSKEEFRELQIKLSLLISKISNKLLWAVLYRNGETANNLLESLRTVDSEYLGVKIAQELADKENREIIEEIQTRQAFVIGMIGFVIVVLAAAAIATIIFTAPVPMTALTITGIVITGAIEAVGVAGVGVAIFHRVKEIPYTQVEEIGADKLAQAKAANGRAKET